MLKWNQSTAITEPSKPALDLFSVDYFDSSNDNEITGKYWRAKYNTTANQISDKFCSNSNFECEMGRERERKKMGIAIEMCRRWGRKNTDEKFSVSKYISIQPIQLECFCNWNMKYVVRALFPFFFQYSIFVGILLYYFLDFIIL